MLNGYRRRFVAINMALIALVLALALGMQMLHVCRTEYSDLQKTMGLILEPWRGAGDFRPQEIKPQGEPPAFEGEVPEPPSERERIGNERMVTVFYDRESGEMSILPEDRPVDRDTIALAVEAAAERKEDFGRLSEYNLYYRKQGTDSDLRIVLADSAYLASQIWRRALVLLGVYALALGLFFLISLRLSKLAAKPMEQAVEMERQFVADISHDLKTPITVVLANNAILKSSPEATVGEQAQWIDSTGDAARSMMDMVEQMLTLSSLEGSGRTVEKQPVNLSACAEKSVLQLESLAYDRSVALREDIAPGVIVPGDEDGCLRILSGLIENALKYEPSGGSVDIRLAREKKKAVLTVSNPGSRIAPEDLPHIFERFYRGDKARSSQTGHGLGLPIVKQLCDSLGAEIRARSSEEGTVFTVSFELT